MSRAVLESKRPRVPAGRYYLALLLCVETLLAPGCSSTGKPHGEFASVVITQKSAEQIQHETMAVFTSEGYSCNTPGLFQMVFQRDASTMDQIAYGGWLSDSGVAIRAKVHLVDLGSSNYQLQCTAYMVQNAGAGFFEEERKLGSSRRLKPFQELLDRVAAQLQ